MLRVTFLSTILALATAGTAQKSVIANFIAPVSSGAPEAAAAVTASPASSDPLVVRQARDGLFYVDAMVNGQSVRFLIDSGASVVFLSARDAARTGVRSGHGSVEAETAGGSASMKRTRIGDIAIAGQTISDVDAAIVGSGLKVSLLGQSALSKLGSVTFKGDRVLLN
jgi:aspartyl protease family protein